MVSTTVKLELLSPRGEIEPPPVYFPSPRVLDLKGKRIGMYSNGKPGVDNFYTALESILKERFPDITTVRLTGAFEIRNDDAEKFASEIDTFIYAIGD